MHRTRVVAVLAVLLVAGLAAGLTWAVTRSGDSAEAAPDPAGAARTALPGLTPAAGEPELPGLATARPAPGTVARVPGPFDDRFVLHDLSLGRTAVSGAVEVTSDVSELLELQVLVGFYDRSGTLVGEGRYTHHATDDGHAHTGPPEEREEFSVQIPPEHRAVVTAAAVGVPVLVNE